MAFQQAGYSVVPASADGSKAPAGRWQRYQAERPDGDQVAAWLGNGTYDGFGLVCGTVSGGLEMLEFEGRAVAQGVHVAYRDALADHGLSDVWKRIVTGYAESTPGRGLHILYRVDGAVRGNTRLARTAGGEVLIETRGEGGFTIVAPSAGRTHPSGKAWRVEKGGPATIATISEAERDALHAVASLLDQQPVPAAPAPAPGGSQEHGRPGDDFSARASWTDILVPHGWQCTRAFGSDGHGWRRPGKEGPGISATTRESGGLYVFTTSTGFQPETLYSKFGAYALLEHGGDHSAAAAQLRRTGYGAPRPHDDAGIGELVAAQSAVSAESPGQSHSADSADSAAGMSLWEPPVPLGGVRALPDFPLGIYPDWLHRLITCLTEFAQVPADLPGVLALPALAAAAGGRVVVEVRGSWREPVNLYTVSALPPGSRKSAVFAELTQPLMDAEQHLVNVTGPLAIEAITARKIAQRDAEKLAAKASGLEGELRDQALADAIAAAQLAEAMTVPAMPKLVADDVTPEAAASLLAEQGGRLAVLSAEGGCFTTLAGRYSGTPNLEVFLKGHSGDMLRVDRKGRPPEHIPHPALTLGLAVQPQVLRDIAAMPGFRGRGLLARILYSMPANTVGSRKIRTDPIPEDVRDTYAASIRTLVLTLSEWTDPAVLMLSPDAAELLLTAAESLEPRLGPDGDLGHIADWASKLIGATARIAGLLHLAANVHDGWGKPITDATMAAAIQAAAYFTEHALAAFDGMGADPVLEDARAILRWLQRSQLARFTKREAFTGLSRSRFPKAGDLDAPLALLEQHGYIRLADQPDRPGPGRKPSPEYAIHPDLDDTALRS